MNFYVYAHYRLDNDALFYLGKGKNSRAYSKHNRNTYWHHIVNKHGYRVEILKASLTEDEAYKKEIDLIKTLSPCANLTKGGSGGDTFSKLSKTKQNKLKEEARSRAFTRDSGIAKAAKIRIGKTKDTDSGLMRMAIKNSNKFRGISNPMYGKSHWLMRSEEENSITKAKISKSLIEKYKKCPRKYEIVKCPHCGKTGGKPGLTRYHFNNCKNKDNE